ncbi:hypothetical protein BpHYR1_050925 [Brachionus plicatilis]|uniref:RNA-directed DNA polymerase from mobile element jockey-like n=1 Tax=Brachionus plicatilis TaxID=10195 RepID=A0A3M7R254_BRAPC|nr:hypothetical protein BpHYR1_050925 [Brachionus plicatilis]
MYNYLLGRLMFSIVILAWLTNFLNTSAIQYKIYSTKKYNIEQIFTKEFQTLQFSKGDLAKISETKSNCDWNTEFSDQSIDSCYDRFPTIYNSMSEKFIPKFKSCIIRKRLSWMNPELLGFIQLKKTTWHKLKALGRFDLSINENCYKFAKYFFNCQKLFFGSRKDYEKAPIPTIRLLRMFAKSVII